MESRTLQRFEEVNKELWLLLSIFVIAGLLNFVITSDHMILSLYVIPTVISAYFYGRRHATMTAVASLLLVVLIAYFNPSMFAEHRVVPVAGERWFGIAAWGGILIITGYLMGTLYERKEAHLRELRESYHGILLILRQFISNDKYTQNHSYRVSIYAAKIGAALGLDAERVEDIRAASMLHDIGKLEISRQVLYKAARLTPEEYEYMQSHVARGLKTLEPVGGSLKRVLPIILAHHDKFDGSGYHPARGQEIPIEARVISVADVYDSLTSDRPYRKAMSPFEAKDIILKGAGTDFDPKVVEAFLAAFKRGELEVPELVV
jgi:HD-GYP domain-containing protein (c-di-GMP phosphodiesterase class II)